ncbi:hypothetical protein FRB93_012805 [Tulasnella sp. JGI-2019a]|nr:hypothetical protein FRB93_012805 [Tulasnella sp. JGI-2019a]
MGFVSRGDENWCMENHEVRDILGELSAGVRNEADIGGGGRFQRVLTIRVGNPTARSSKAIETSRNSRSWISSWELCWRYFDCSRWSLAQVAVLRNFASSDLIVGTTREQGLTGDPSTASIEARGADTTLVLLPNSEVNPFFFSFGSV